MLTFGQHNDTIRVNIGEREMPRTPKQLVSYLKEHGFQEIRQNGTSHLILRNPATGKQTTVPMHNKELSKGLEQAILKQTGLK